MQVKRFVALDMRSALAQIREEFSSDAVILSSRNITGGGVEVLAAFNGAGKEIARESTVSKPQLSAKSKALRKSLEEVGSNRKTTNTPAPRAGRNELPRQQAAATVVKTKVAAIPKVDSTKLIGEMRSELNGIRNLMEQRLNGLSWEQFARRTPVQAVVWERLNNLGLPGFVNKSLLDRLRLDHTAEEAWRFALAWLSRSIPVCSQDIVANGGVFALLGPTGAGKTTTIGKLASRFVLAHGAKEVALVTTDSYRVAAHEQLRAFGRILGINVRVVDEKHGLAQTLAGLWQKKLVLIDTAGISPALTHMQSQLAELQAVPQVQ